MQALEKKMVVVGKLDLLTTLATGSKQALFVWKRTKVQEISREARGKSVEYRVSREYRNIDGGEGTAVPHETLHSVFETHSF
jgi:hypothetical protein